MFFSSLDYCSWQNNSAIVVKILSMLLREIRSTLCNILLFIVFHYSIGSLPTSQYAFNLNVKEMRVKVWILNDRKEVNVSCWSRDSFRPAREKLRAVSIDYPMIMWKHLNKWEAYPAHLLYKCWLKRVRQNGMHWCPVLFLLAFLALVSPLKPCLLKAIMSFT